MKPLNSFLIGLTGLFLTFVTLAYGISFLIPESSCPLEVGDSAFDPESGKQGMVIGIDSKGAWTTNCRVVVRHLDNSTSGPKAAYYFEKGA